MNHYPYPESEHLELAADSYDIIDEELRYYHDGPELRQGIIGIDRTYNRTSFAQGLKKAARALTVAQLAADLPNEAGNSAEAFFYAGGIFETHVAVKPMLRATRQYVLNWDFFQHRFGSDESGMALNTEEIEQYCDDMLAFREHGWPDYFNAQEKRCQDRLVTVADRLFSDVPYSGNFHNDFMAGYLYAGSLISFISINE